jgi:hypothetical protein
MNAEIERMFDSTNTTYRIDLSRQDLLETIGHAAIIRIADKVATAVADELLAQHKAELMGLVTMNDIRELVLLKAATRVDKNMVSLFKD